MSESLSLSGQEYIPATLAGKRFGYTSDYITKLAREGHVDGTKVGHQWFVIEGSVKNFIAHKSKEKSARSEEVRLARKVELKEHKEKSELVSKERARSHHLVALTETLVILILGLSLGASGYVITNPEEQSASLATSSYSAVERLAVKLYAFVTGGTEVTTIETTVPAPTVSSGVASGTTQSLSVAMGTTTRTSIIVAPDEVMTTTTIESIRDSFSDDVSVSVDAKNPDTGIITPHFKTKNGEAYRFLLAPINAQGG